MSELSARLLSCGILDNTLNFSAKITNKRDVNAYDELSKIANLPSNWPDIYFNECQKFIENDFAESIKNDTKIIQFRAFTHPVQVGQSVLWDFDRISYQGIQGAIENFKKLSDSWFINIIEIGKKRNHFITTSPEVQQWLAKAFDVKFANNEALTSRMWLRKEIMTRDLELFR